MRRVPDAAAGRGGRIAAADAGDAGRRRTTSRAARAITRKGAAVDAVDLGLGVWPGGDGRLRTLYDIYPAVAAAAGTSRIRRIEPAGLADFSGRNVERMAIHDDTPRGAGDDDAGGSGGNVLSLEGAGRV